MKIVWALKLKSSSCGHRMGVRLYVCACVIPKPVVAHFAFEIRTSSSPMEATDLSPGNLQRFSSF
jgi:hypothetical protein